VERKANYSIAASDISKWNGIVKQNREVRRRRRRRRRKRRRRRNVEF